MTFNVVTNKSYDVVSFSSWPKFTSNLKMDIIRIRGYQETTAFF